MRRLTFLACLALLSACATPDSGYYDANGNWIPYNRYNQEAHAHSPLPGGTHPPYAEDNRDTVTTVTTYSYDRPGYYDYNGYYIANRGNLVPRNMFPPRGMCRVWDPQRDADDQAPVESCSDISYRVPAGSYVIYGG